MAIDAANHAEHGVWPIGGGWLDQTASCLAAVRLVENVRAALRNAELKRG